MPVSATRPDDFSRCYNAYTAALRTPVAEASDLHCCQDNFALSGHEVLSEALSRYEDNCDEVWRHPFLQRRLHPVDLAAIRRTQFDVACAKLTPAQARAFSAIQAEADMHLLAARNGLELGDERVVRDNAAACLRLVPDCVEAYDLRARIAHVLGDSTQESLDRAMATALRNATGGDVQDPPAAATASNAPSTPMLAALNAPNGSTPTAPTRPTPSGISPSSYAALLHLGRTLAPDTEPFDASMAALRGFFPLHQSLSQSEQDAIDTHVRAFELPFSHQLNCTALNIRNQANHLVGVNDLGREILRCLGAT